MALVVSRSDAVTDRQVRDQAKPFRTRERIVDGSCPQGIRSRLMAPGSLFSIPRLQVSPCLPASAAILRVLARRVLASQSGPSLGANLGANREQANMSWSARFSRWSRVARGAIRAAGLGRRAALAG